MLLLVLLSSSKLQLGSALRLDLEGFSLSLSLSLRPPNESGGRQMLRFLFRFCAGISQLDDSLLSFSNISKFFFQIFFSSTIVFQFSLDCSLFHRSLASPYFWILFASPKIHLLILNKYSHKSCE